MKHFAGIELPEAGCVILKEEDRNQVKDKYQSSQSEIRDLIKSSMRKADYNIFLIE